MKRERHETAPADFIIDTNVMVEILSVGDLFSAAQKALTPAAALQSQVVRYRQLRSRHSVLLAWYCSQHKLATGSLHDEVIDILTGKVAPDTDADVYGLTTGFVHFVRPYLLKNWRMGALADVQRGLRSEEADDALLGIAQRDRLPLITNEGLTADGFTDYKMKNGRTTKELNLRGKAKRCDVVVQAPVEYLESHRVDVATEGARFVNAFEQRMDEALRNGALRGAYAAETLDWLLAVYKFILLDLVDAKYSR